MTAGLREMIGGRHLRGVWSALPDSRSVEVLGRSALDFVAVDLQHGYSTLATLPPQLDVLAALGKPSLVRVPGHDPFDIMRVLDLGADGVIVPLVDDAAAAVRMVAAARYGPEGRRSWGPLGPQLGRPRTEAAAADARTTVVVMVETAAGLANVAEIASVPGVDALYVGPNDLGLSLGLGRPHWRDSEPLHAAVERIIAAGRDCGVAVGFDCDGVEEAVHWLELGVDFLILGRDVLLLAEAVDELSPDSTAC